MKSGKVTTGLVLNGMSLSQYSWLGTSGRCQIVRILKGDMAYLKYNVLGQWFIFTQKNNECRYCELLNEDVSIHKWIELHGLNHSEISIEYRD